MPVLTKITLLINPASERGRPATVAPRVARYLRESGAVVDELVGRDASESLDLAHRAVDEGTDALVAFGGDGIVHIAVQAVAGTRTPFGLIPQGTGNDYARMLGIPDDVTAAARIVLAGSVRAIDLGRVGDRWFGTVLAGGFDAKVNDRTNRMRWPRGRWRYNLAILAELASLRPLDYVLDLDGHRIRTQATLVAVGNGPSYGGGMRICPSAVADDGLFDVTVIGATNAARLIRVLPRVYAGTHVEESGVTTYRARHVALSTRDVTAYADGEPLAALPLSCECVALAARALVPVEPG